MVGPCSRGIYYRDQGFSACSDVGSSVKFRWSDGTEISNTAAISRGYKAGLNYIQTAGAKSTMLRAMVVMVQKVDKVELMVMVEQVVVDIMMDLSLLLLLLLVVAHSMMLELF